jgi:uncharacterized protein YjbI with pentapeptide repeats
MNSYYQETFDASNWKEIQFGQAEFEDCEFMGIDFDSTSLERINFVECRFIECNLSNVSFYESILNDVFFEKCKMLGILFHKANKFILTLRFEGCVLSHSIFTGISLKKTKFLECELKEVDFSECDLTDADFSNSDMFGAIFEKCLLAKTDFISAQNYQINLSNNTIQKPKFNRLNLAGLLADYPLDITD